MEIALIGPHPIALMLLFAMGIIVLNGERKNVYGAMLVIVLWITLGQRIIIVGLDFTYLRIIMVLGLIRLIIKRENNLTWTSLDKAVLAWGIVSMATYTILWTDSAKFIYKAGILLDISGMYLVPRFLIKDIKDFNRVLKTLSLLIIPLAGLMIIERKTGHNPFAAFGGVSELSIVREGVVRSQGSFQHPLLIGTFAATSIPLIASILLYDRRNRKFMGVGILCCLIIVICTASSGPLMTVGASFLGIGMWLIRKRVRLIWYSFIAAVFTLHFFVMKSPVWHLMGRMSNIIGGNGWFRAYLIDQAIRYLPDWWLVGTKITGHWMMTQLSYSELRADIPNYFLVQGVDGGLITMILLVVILVCAFRGLSNTIKLVEYAPLNAHLTIWCCGAAMFAHIVSFFNVGYYDQLNAFWFLLLSVISTMQQNPSGFFLLDDQSLGTAYGESKDPLTTPAVTI